MRYPTRSVDQKWRRLIPSRFPPIDIYERLGSPELARAAIDSENRTNPRLLAREWLVEGSPRVDARSPRLQNWNHAPFAYKNPEGSTFLDKAFGVMEVADSVEAALAIAVRRREIFLSRTDEPPTNLDMRMLVTRIAGEFADLTGLPRDASQRDRRRIGLEVYNADGCGVLFKCAERPDATCLAVFDNRVVGTTEQAAHYRFVWDGKQIRSVYDFSPPGNVIERSALITGAIEQEAA